jgi:LacI family transcriptional regulator
VTVNKPTIDDVASLAGVGRTTVSRVLNNKPNVRDEVRDKVLRAVEMLDYRVNLQARNLAGRTSHRILLIHASDFDTEPNSYYSSAIELGATRAAARLGMQLSTHIVNQNDPLAAATILSFIREVQCEGLVLTPPFSDNLALVAAVQAQECRVFCIAGGPEVAKIAPTLGIDDRCAGYDIGCHLLALGHRRFGFIHGLVQHISAESRFEGFLAAVTEHGLGADAVTSERGNFTFRSGIECAQRILDRPDRPTAIVCANDDMAAGALLAAHKAGLEIPGEIAITGFDDTPVSEIVWPPLTTVHQPLRRMGERAVERLTQIIAAEQDAENPVLPELVDHRLVVRESSLQGA